VLKPVSQVNILLLLCAAESPGAIVDVEAEVVDKD
jgi:hypothetical protein